MVPETGIAIVDSFLALLGQSGYLVVFAATVSENVFVVGSLTPGEMVVIASSFVASAGGLKLWLVWGASVLGTVAGSNLSYLLGRKAGIENVRALAERVAATRIGRILRIDPAGIDEVQEHFDVDGSKTVFFSRFATGAKNFVPAMAGAVRMPVFWFEFHTLLGAITQSTLMCVIGWFVGENMDRALRVATGASWVGFAVFVSFVLGVWLTRKRVKARRAAQALAEGAAGDSDAEGGS